MDPLMEQSMRLAYRGQQHAWRAIGRVMGGVIQRLFEGPRPAPHLQRMAQRSFEQLIERDCENAAAGIYPWSLLFQIPYSRYAQALPRLVLDAPDILRRRQADAWKELPAEVELDAYPPYYRRTFHWQRDGYLSRRSAELYDVGVELLFGGTADVMRRQVIPPIVAHARELGRPLRILEVACGTGRTAAQVVQALPDAVFTGVDLSPFYVELAQERVSGRQIDFVTANAEQLPFDDESFDAVFSVYLFHELPRNARRRVWEQMHRVVRPGGCVVIEDSIQRGDAAEMAVVLERFPQDMHEPFYRDYMDDDLAEGMAESGLVVRETERAFMSKVVSAYRTAAT